MTKFNQILKSTRGSIAIYVLLTLVVLYPMLLFLTIEFPFLTNNHRRLKNNLDNAVSSAILCLEEDELSQGRITLNDMCVKTTVYKILAANYKLNPDTLMPLEGSIVSKRPIIQIRTINNPTTTEKVRMPDQNMTDSEKFQDVYVDKTSVVIYAEFEFNGVIFKSFKPIVKQISSAQSSFGVH